MTNIAYVTNDMNFDHYNHLTSSSFSWDISQDMRQPFITIIVLTKQNQNCHSIHIIALWQVQKYRIFRNYYSRWQISMRRRLKKPNICNLILIFFDDTICVCRFFRFSFLRWAICHCTHCFHSALIQKEEDKQQHQNNNSF